MEDSFKGFIELDVANEGGTSTIFCPTEVLLTSGVLMNGVRYPDEWATVVTEAVFQEDMFPRSGTGLLPDPMGYLVKIKIPASFQERHGIICDGECRTLDEALVGGSIMDEAYARCEPETEAFKACIAQVVQELRSSRGILQIILSKNTLHDGVPARDRAQAVHREAAGLLKYVDNASMLNEVMKKLIEYAATFSY